MEPTDRAMAPIVITGGSGFIGHHLMERLLAEGHSLRNVDVKPSRLQSPRLEHWPGNFQDTTRLREALAGADTIFHLAASRFPRESNRNPLQDAQENIIGTLGLLDLAVEAGVRRLVFCSSGGTVYGPTSAHLIAEDHPTHPIAAYGISKLAIEKYLRLYALQHGIGTVTLRIANPYGPFQSITKAQGALTTFCHKALQDEEIEIWGDGSVERDYLHVQDVAAALAAAARSPVSGCEINVGSGQGTSLNELLGLISTILGRPLRHRYLDARDFDVPRNVLSVSLARELLGWEPRIGLAEGVAQLLAQMGEH